MQRFKREEIMIGLVRFTTVFVCLVLVALVAVPAHTQTPLGNEQYAFKVYAINSAFYPIVQVYLRTWDQNRDPLMNVNYMNIGLMVAGQSYDPAKIEPQSRRPQYGIETLQNREEGFRTVLVLDCSLSMAGKPFADAQNALVRYVEAKRRSDQVAIIAVRDTDQGYQLVSGFERDATPLFQRLADVKCDGQKTRLYDAVAAAMEMCATASQGGTSNTSGAEHAVLNAILVLSDGKDEGSAVARDELMSRIGQLPIPIPIYALAYAKSDRSSFLNLEALSKGSFGRYWRHEDSQEFGATIQKIHHIQRSDYVITFRSYVPVDGAKHPLKLGISWPSNTGRFVFDSVDFEAVKSPAQYVPEAQALLRRLEEEYPPLPEGCPYMECPESVATLSQDPIPPAGPGELGHNPSAVQLTQLQDEPVIEDPTPAPVQEEAAAVIVDPTPAPIEPAEAENDVMAFLRANGGLLGLGAGLLAVIIAILAWVRRGGSSISRRDTSVLVRNPSNENHRALSSASTSITSDPQPEPSDTTTRF
jgi:hypothetical protein